MGIKLLQAHIVLEIGRYHEIILFLDSLFGFLPPLLRDCQVVLAYPLKVLNLVLPRILPLHDVVV